MKRALIIAGFLGLIFILVWKRQGNQEKSLYGSAMGVRWTLSWRGKGPPPEILKREVSNVLEKWEQTLSQWRPGSDLSKYNRGNPATPDLARVIAMADALQKATGGAFDHHLLEQVHQAGFGPPGKGLDLSSIGKGFAVDRVGEHLRELGVNDFVFALAGEVLAGDGTWPVEIERPTIEDSKVFKVVALKNSAIATSGNYRQFSLDAGGLKTHIIDPKSGKSVIRPLSSVTVRTKECATASSWATALFVLGPEFTDYPEDLDVIWQP